MFDEVLRQLDYCNYAQITPGNLCENYWDLFLAMSYFVEQILSAVRRMYTWEISRWQCAGKLSPPVLKCGYWLVVWITLCLFCYNCLRELLCARCNRNVYVSLFDCWIFPKYLHNKHFFRLVVACVGKKIVKPRWANPRTSGSVIRCRTNDSQLARVSKGIWWLTTGRFARSFTMIRGS